MEVFNWYVLYIYIYINIYNVIKSIKAYESQDVIIYWLERNIQPIFCIAFLDLFCIFCGCNELYSPFLFNTFFIRKENIAANIASCSIFISLMIHRNIRTSGNIWIRKWLFRTSSLMNISYLHHKTSKICVSLFLTVWTPSKRIFTFSK